MTVHPAISPNYDLPTCILPPDEESMPDEFVRKMNQIADGTPKDIQAPTDDTTFERKSRDLVKLFQVSDESGTLTVTEVGSYPLKRELLDSKVCARLQSQSFLVYFL